MPTAKLFALPNIGANELAIDKLVLLDKAVGWTGITSFLVTSNVITTPFKTTASELNSTYWVKIQGKTGYKIASCYKTNYEGSLNMGDIPIDPDGSVTVYTWQTGTASTLNNYVYFDIAPDDDGKRTVTTNLINCVGNNLNEYDLNSEVTIALTPSEGFKFSSIPSLLMGDVTIPFIVSDDGISAYLTFIITDDVVISAEAKQAYIIDLVLKNCTCSHQYLFAGDQTITVVASPGYEFSGSISVKNQINIIQVFNNFIDDNTKCVININVSGNITLTATANKKTGKISPFANLYYVDDAILTLLSKARFFSDSDGVIDYGSYISNLYQLPFKLPDEMISDSVNIQLGNYNTTVITPSLTGYIYTLDLGEINIPLKYNNVYDYKNVSCRLHLPYCPTMVIDAEYVINHTLSIEYVVDLYGANCTANVYSTMINDIIGSETFTIGSTIPFMQKQTNSPVSEADIIINNGVLTPFIEIIRNIPYDYDANILGRGVIEYGKISDYEGYLECDKILLKSSASNQEQEQIKSLLRNGVLI